jgi:hypothetical protein
MLGEAGAVHWAHLKVNGLTPYRKSLVKFEAAQWSTVVVVEHCMDSYFTILKLKRPVRLAYQPPASSTFLSEQTSHQQPGNSTFLSEQTSTSHQPPAIRTGLKLS